MAKTVREARLFVPHHPGAIVVDYVIADGGAEKRAEIVPDISAGLLAGPLAALWTEVVNQVKAAEGIG